VGEIVALIVQKCTIDDVASLQRIRFEASAGGRFVSAIVGRNKRTQDDGDHGLVSFSFSFSSFFQCVGTGNRKGRSKIASRLSF
jgi:hypothetical protein